MTGTVVVAGALANKAGNGGEAWVRLSWVKGLQQLGVDVWFVEELASSSCSDAEGLPVAPLASTQVAYFREVIQRFGIPGQATLLVDGDAICGPSVSELLAVAPSAVLVNISGHLADSRLFPAFRTRVLIDVDPGFTQFWHHRGDPGARVAGHDLHFTIGENIGAVDCPIPTCGLRWHTVRQPVVLTDWPVVADGERDRFTTVANWRGPFGPIEDGARTYGLKVHEFRKFIDLPSRSPHRFELALNIAPSDGVDRAALQDNGWHLVDPATLAGTDAFRSYVQASGAEFSVAQGIYVDTRSGWFSDRTVRYLASGRPALVQDTGVSRHLPTGDGLVVFSTIEEAVAGADRIVADYAAHAAAARAIAERSFASDRVLARFCEQVAL